MSERLTAPILQAAVGYSDRVFPLLDGSVVLDRPALAFVASAPDELFWKALHSDDYDLLEMSFAAYCILRSRSDGRFLALPIFTSRAFRHNAVYVRADSPLTRLEELAGKAVGVPEYQMTAAVWVRGFLQHDAGVFPSDVVWHAGGVDKPNRTDRIPFSAPPGVDVRRAPEDVTLTSMLLEGVLDAIVSPRAPGGAGIRPLLTDPRAAEIEYYDRYAIFPIMHLVVVRRGVYERHRADLIRVYRAFDAARQLAERRLRDTETQACMLPWLAREIEFTERVMGRDYWPYGFRRNRACVDHFLGLLSEQGLLQRPLQAGEIFAPELLDT